jgi:DNA-binding transcriptional LysR family regulator
MIRRGAIRDTYDVDTNLLRAFVEVARRRSFSAAARELGYTQSAVSQQVAALETDLGVALLHRRPVAPTEAGERLLEHAAPILLRLDAARADVRRLSGAPPTRLLVGASPLADTRRVTTACAQLQRSMPRVSLTLRVTGRDAVVSGVAEADLDLGFVDGVTAASDPLHLLDAGPLTTVATSEGPVVVAMPKAHPFAGRRRLALADLVDARWVDAPDTATPLTHLRAVVRADGFPAGLRYDGTDVHTLLALVAAGGGLALLPEPVVRRCPELTGVPLAEPRLVHRTELVHGTVTGPAGELAAAIRA